MVLTIRFFRRISFILDFLYLSWVRNCLGYVGKNTSVSRGLDLQGDGYKQIFVGNDSNIGKNFILGCWTNYNGETYNPRIIIGDNCSLGDYNHITAINYIEIGNGVLTGRWVTITDNSHGMTDYESLSTRPILRRLYSKGPVIIGDNVWIGDKDSGDKTFCS